MVTIRLHPETHTAAATFKSLGRVPIALRFDNEREGWGQLTIGDRACVMMRGWASEREGMSDDAFFDSCLIPQWHGWITIGGVERRVSVDPETWVLAFH